jgi:hypothetical protein
MNGWRDGWTDERKEGWPDVWMEEYLFIFISNGRYISCLSLTYATKKSKKFKIAL